MLADVFMFEFVICTLDHGVSQLGMYVALLFPML